MRRVRIAKQALGLTVEPHRPQYVCRACLAQAARQFSTTTLRPTEELPFYKRIQNQIFGTQASKRAEKSRMEKDKKRLERVMEDGEPTTKVDKHGNVYEIARLVNPATEEGYVAATTWKGLDTVGGEKWVRDRADQGEQYTGWMPPTKKHHSNEQYRKLLHHITVEVLTLHKAGRDMLEVCNARTASANTAEHTAATKLDPGSGSLAFESPEAEQAILDAVTGELEADQAPTQAALATQLLAATARRITLPYDDSGSGPNAWMQLSLRDQKVKLAIFKRTMQLTGHRVPDPMLSSSTTVADLWRAFGTKEKPQKLIHTPQLQTIKNSLPNVTVHASRRTPIHKEKEIGRWKIIEDELTLRNLPITGSRLQGAKEGLRNNGL